MKVSFCFITTDESKSLNKNSQTSTVSGWNQIPAPWKCKPRLVSVLFSSFVSFSVVIFLSPHFTLTQVFAVLSRLTHGPPQSECFCYLPEKKIFTICILKHFVPSVNFMAIKNKATKIKAQHCLSFSVYGGTICSAQHGNKSVKVQFSSSCN